MTSVIVWDIETVPDLKGFAAANGHVGKSDGAPPEPARGMQRGSPAGALGRAGAAV